MAYVFRDDGGVCVGGWLGGGGGVEERVTKRLQLRKGTGNRVHLNGATPRFH